MLSRYAPWRGSYTFNPRFIDSVKTKIKPILHFHNFAFELQPITEEPLQLLALSDALRQLIREFYADGLRMTTSLVIEELGYYGHPHNEDHKHLRQAPRIGISVEHTHTTLVNNSILESRTDSNLDIKEHLSALGHK